MEAKEYFNKEYGDSHIKSVVDIKDLDSLYGLMEEYAENKFNSITKEYTIDFDGNVLTELEITNNKIKIIESMDGWGKPIDNKYIDIIKVE